MFAFIWKPSSLSPNGSDSCGAQRAIYFFQVSVMHHFYNPGPRRHLFAFASAPIVNDRIESDRQQSDLVSISITFTES